MRPHEIIARVRITALIMSVILLPYSITFCHFFILLFIVTGLPYGKWRTKITMLLVSPVVLLFILFFALHLIGILYSADQKSAWFDIEKKAFLFALPIALITSPSIGKEQTHRLFNWFIASCLTATFVCLYYGFLGASASNESFHLNSLTSSEFYSPSFSNLWKFFTYGPLASGININPSYFSLYLVFCLLLLFHLSEESFKNYSFAKKTGLCLISLYLCVFIVLLSSRIMIIALLVLIGFASYNYFSAEKLWRKLVFAFLIIGFLCSLIYLNPVSRYRSEEVMITSKTFKPESLHTQSVSIRASLWWQGIKAFQSVNPLIGAGPGDVISVMENAGRQHHISNVLGSSNPHNQFLYTLISLGGIGFIVLLGCLFIPALFALKQRNYFYLGFILIFTLLCITESALEFQKGIAFFALFNSIMVSGYCDLRIPSLKKITS
jgi:O-antigen ligase